MNKMMILVFLLTYINLNQALSVGTFLQITDIHFDQYYTPGSSANCYFGSTGLGCCRRLSISKEPYRTASKWGDYNCDLPLLFVNESFRWISSNIKTPDFIIWNGDSVDHHDITQTLNSNIEEINIITKLFSEYFNQIAIVPMIGNHDTYPIDQVYYNFNETELSYELSVVWKDMIPQEQLYTFSYGGYYTVNLTSNVSLMIINSLLYDNNNIYSYLVDDPSNQKQWINQTLNRLRNEHKRVWIAGHIPLNSVECNETFSKWFYDICIEYSDIIQYQFWGHTHDDYYYLIMDNENPVGFHYVSPSLTADWRFSSFREYLYDRETMQILDYSHYVANLTDIIINNKIDYTLEYMAKQNYMIKSFDPDGYYDFYQRLNKNDTLFQSYYSHYTPGFNLGYCNQTCKQNYIKEIVSLMH